MPTAQAQDRSRRRLSCHLPRVTGYTSIPPQQATNVESENPESRAQHTAGTRAYLLCLALEALLGLIRPSPRKGRLPRFDHKWVERMDLSIVSIAGLNCRHNRPTASRRVLQMFF
jgi:hypothetical protein